MDSDASALEFLSAGDLIGQAVRLYWRNITMILQVLLMPAIGCTVGKICMHWPLTLCKIKDTLPDLSLILIGVASALVGFFILLYSVWILMLRQFALVRLFVAENKEGGQSFKDAYQFIKSKQWPILGLFTLGLLTSLTAVFLWVLLIVITSFVVKLDVIPTGFLIAFLAAEIFSMFIAMAVISMIYWLAVNQMILENGRVMEAISQSWLMSWPNFWRIFFFVWLSFLVTGLLTWPLSLPLVAYSIAEIFMRGAQGFNQQEFIYWLREELLSFHANGFYRLVLIQVWESIINIITWPVFYFAWGLFYQDQKRRLFAPDLLLKLQKLNPQTNSSGG